MAGFALPDPGNQSEGLRVVPGDYDRPGTESVTPVSEEVTLESGTHRRVEYRPLPIRVEREKDLAGGVTNDLQRRSEHGLPVLGVGASRRTSALYPRLNIGYPS